MSEPGTITFQCNICYNVNENAPLAGFGREEATCRHCGSSVRMRGIIHCLSLALFGRSMPLDAFPVRYDVVGIGLSDWVGYGERLPAKFAYTNTFYHQPPFLDIVEPPAHLCGINDFVISTDVFEHVPPPVARAFEGTFKLLKPGGLLVLTVPFTDVLETIEHFPNLSKFKVIEFDDHYFMLNRTTGGEYEVYEDLVFHGGPGDTLEMRIFSRAHTIALLQNSGFVDIVVHSDTIPQWGIIPPHGHGLPITAWRR